MSPPHKSPLSVEETSRRLGPGRRAWRLALPLLVMGLGIGGAVWLIRTAPQAPRQPPAPVARLVEVVEVRFGPQQVRIPALGLVLPAREVTLYPRVAGEVVAIHDQFLPGSRFAAGEVLVQIDPSDFRLAVAQRESELVQARSALALEQGQQAVARQEYELLGREIPEADRDLVLRRPQLEQARARVQAAEAALEQARLNLERTSVRAPFACTVRARMVNVGSQVTPATPLATLAGAEEYWVEATVPVDQLEWLWIPGRNSPTGSVARIWRAAGSRDGAARVGTVLRLLPDLEKDGRLARVLVSVMDPLALQAQHTALPPLLLGDAVRLELEGRTVEAAALDRRWFRDGDQVWIMNERNELEIRPVQVAFRAPEVLLVTGGLRPGERIVISELPAAVPGLPLRLANAPQSDARGQATASVVRVDSREHRP
ncbi:MAG: efflux RND transporter periplasmic adaptor subunit [Limisphaera sp.]|nr:efflux RND transporter periplasmic adaptor subunit [Limisphaera sp.]